MRREEEGKGRRKGEQGGTWKEKKVIGKREEKWEMEGE